MMRSSPRFDSDVDAVLTGAKVIRPLPAAVRSRALARARAGMATAAKAGFEPALRTPRRRGFVIALAASLAIAVVAATAVAALGIQAARRNASAPPAGPHAAAPAPVAVPPPPAVAAAPTVEQPTVDEQMPAAPKPQRTTRPTSAQESYAAELELLTRAQVAYAGRDFTNALGLVAEHGKRFPSGRLIEEREALRVRSLTGAGRADEAQRAAAAFAERFPRSILLSRPGRALR
jgi:hypothetical protein